MDVENKHQQEVRQVLEELESLSSELKVKTRILDSIREMKKEIEEPFSETEWKKKIAEVDELITYVKQQADLTEKMISLDDGVSVTEEEVMEKISEILDNCYSVGELQNEIYEKGYVNCARKAEQDMREMTNVEANFKENLSANLFRDYFQKVGQRYEEQMNREAEQYVKELAEGYQTAMKKIRNLISSLSYDALGISSRELYKQWDENLDDVERKMRHEAAKIEKGGRVISEFGETNVEPVQKIVKKNEKKRSRMKKMPLYVMLASIAGIVISVVTLIMGIGSAVKTIASSTQMDMKTADAALDLIRKGAGIFKTIGKTTGKASAAGGSMSFLSIVLIISILWYLLIKITDKKYKKRVCKEVSNYMIRQVDFFWKEELLKNLMEESEESIRRIVNDNYRSIFASMFQKAFLRGKEDADEKSRLLKLCNEWEQIRRSVQ